MYWSIVGMVVVAGVVRGINAASARMGTAVATPATLSTIFQERRSVGHSCSARPAETRRRPHTGTSSGIATSPKKYGGNAGTM